jgi:hypothetical protein
MNEGFDGGRRFFIALVEAERDRQDEHDGGWVIFDSIAESLCEDLCDMQDFHPRYFNAKEGLLLLRARVDELPNGQQWLDRANGTWVRIQVHAASGELPQAEVVLFGPADGEPPRVGLEIMKEKPSLSIIRYLDRFSMLASELRAPASLISGVLDLALNDINPDDIAIAAYDVGQGNCNAIVDEFEHPRIFFDLGWAPNFHSKSRPYDQPDFFNCDQLLGAPVVLSHWDMDHWCYAIQNSTFNRGSLTTAHSWKPAALKRFWIARAPQKKKHKIGALTMAFYDELKNTYMFHGLSAILLWPKNAKKISFSFGWLEACCQSGVAPDDRNNNGIAMFVRPTPRAPGILLTGDAYFESIPCLYSKIPLAGLVAPHHGAAVTPGYIPAPAPGSPARLVMSVGAHNTYGHPKQASINGYNAQGWVSSRTQDRFGCICKTGSLVHSHGNSLLKFNVGPDPKCRCSCVPSGNLCLLPSTLAFPKPIAGVKPLKKSGNKKSAKAGSPV